MTHRMARSGAWFAFAALATGGCGVIFPVHEVPDGADGAPPPADGAPLPADARADAGFCASLATPHVSCDDFDEGTTLGASWNAASGMALDTNVFTSPPASLRVASTGGSTENASRTVQLTNAVRLELDYLPEQLGADHLASVAAILVRADQPLQRKAILYVSTTTTQLAEDAYDASGNFAGETPHDLGIVPDGTTFTRYALALDANANPPTMTVQIGSATRVIALGGDWHATSYAIGLGLYVNGSTQPWSVRYDNVVVR